MELADLVKFLEKNPYIKARLEALINVTENSSGEFTRADDAEKAVVEGVRAMGHNVLQNWAIKQNEKQEVLASNNTTLKRHSKKNFTGKQRSATFK